MLVEALKQGRIGVEELAAAFHLENILQKRFEVPVVVGKIDLSSVYNHQRGLLIVIKELGITFGQRAQIICLYQLLAIQAPSFNSLLQYFRGRL